MFDYRPSEDQARNSPLLEGPDVSLSHPFRQGASVEAHVREADLRYDSSACTTSSGSSAGASSTCSSPPAHAPQAEAQFVDASPSGAQ